MTDDTLAPPKKKTNQGRKPGTRFTQRPRSDYEKAKRVQVPPPGNVDRAKDRAAADMQQSARVEILMLKGISSPHILGGLLGISEREINRFIGLVHSRWVVTGSGLDIKRYQGQALARLDLLSSELWSRTTSDNVDLSMSDRISAIKALMGLELQRNAILGLTPSAVERIAMLPSAGGLANKIQEQDNLARIAERFLAIMADRRRAAGTAELPMIEGESYEDDAEADEITAH